MIRTSNVFAGSSSVVPVPSAATSTKLYYRTDLSNVDATISYGGGTSVAVEVINDSTTNNVAINFTGAAAAIPGSSTSLVDNHLVLPKEARYFSVSSTTAHIIASAASTTVRVTIFFV